MNRPSVSKATVHSYAHTRSVRREGGARTKTIENPIEILRVFQFFPKIVLQISLVPSLLKTIFVTDHLCLWFFHKYVSTVSSIRIL